MLGFASASERKHPPHHTPCSMCMCATVCVPLYVCHPRFAVNVGIPPWPTSLSNVDAWQCMCAILEGAPNLRRFVHVDLETHFAPQRCAFSTSQFPTVLRNGGVFYILMSKYVSRHNGMHFSNIATSKSVPDLRYFAHF